MCFRKQTVSVQNHHFKHDETHSYIQTNIAKYHIHLAKNTSTSAATQHSKFLVGKKSSLASHLIYRLQDAYLKTHALIHLHFFQIRSSATELHGERQYLHSSA